MRRALTFAAALAAAFLCLALAAPAGPARASARGDWWRGQAVTALARYIASNTGADDTFTYGRATGAAAFLYGWTDSRTLTLLGQLRATKLSGGGYGLGRVYDAFNDGTTNPADTAYAVTLASHVGPTLLHGYKAGAIPKAEIQAVVDQLVQMPRVTVGRGQCVAYSNSPNDRPPAGYPAGGCVHNVNAGVAWFLSDANAAGLGATGMQKLITDITLQEVIAFREATNTWPYIDDGPILDADHDSYSAESMYRLAYWIGRESTYKWMSTPPPPGEARGPIIHTRLAGSPGGNGSYSRTEPGVILWCQMSDQWRDEQAEYQATQTGAGLAQFAYYAARASRNCA